MLFGLLPCVTGIWTLFPCWLVRRTWCFYMGLHKGETFSCSPSSIPPCSPHNPGVSRWLAAYINIAFATSPSVLESSSKPGPRLPISSSEALSARVYALIAYSMESLSITANQLKAMTPSCFCWFVWVGGDIGGAHLQLKIVMNWKQF